MLGKLRAGRQAKEERMGWLEGVVCIWPTLSCLCDTGLAETTIWNVLSPSFPPVRLHKSTFYTNHPWVSHLAWISSSSDLIWCFNRTVLHRSRKLLFKDLFMKRLTNAYGMPDTLLGSTVQELSSQPLSILGPPFAKFPTFSLDWKILKERDHSHLYPPCLAKPYAGSAPIRWLNRWWMAMPSCSNQVFHSC